MGWCSGTEIFDVICRFAVDSDIDESEKIALLRDVINVLHDMDWDCEYDSQYIDEPLIRKAFIKTDREWKERFRDHDRDYEDENDED